MYLVVRLLAVIGLLLVLAIGPTEASAPDGHEPHRLDPVFYDLSRLEIQNDILMKTLAEQIDMPTMSERMQIQYELANQLSTSEQERVKDSFLKILRYMILDLAPERFWDTQLAEYYAAALSSQDAHKILEAYDNLDDLSSGKKFKVIRRRFWEDAMPALLLEIRSWTRAFNIPSPGMAPSLLPGDHIIVNKSSYRNQAPQRGDVIVFQFPEDETKLFVKRVIGTPGDLVELRNKVVYLNGQPLQEDSYAQHTDHNIIEASVNPRDNLAAITVPAESYFVLGDNRESSLDSRFWGFVKRSKVLGRVMIIYWSVDTGSKAPRWDRLNKQVH